MPLRHSNILPAAATLRLATNSKDNDPLTQAAKRAADDPYPDASTLQLIASVRIGAKPAPGFVNYECLSSAGFEIVSDHIKWSF